jgi:hypothetical protein
MLGDERLENETLIIRVWLNQQHLSKDDFVFPIDKAAQKN